jgi:2-hydroxyacyl-CoA lyase 1
LDPPDECPGDGQWVEDPRDLRGALDNAMAFDGPAVLNVKLHHAAGHKPQEFGWLTT